MEKGILLSLLCLPLMLTLANCSRHQHDFSSKWSHDSTDHYHECACGETNDKAEHVFDEGVRVSEPTIEEDGIMKYTCKICSYQKTTNIPKLGIPEAPQDLRVSFEENHTSFHWSKLPANEYETIIRYEVSVRLEHIADQTWVPAHMETEHHFMNLDYTETHTFEVRAISEIATGEVGKLTTTVKGPSQVRFIKAYSFDQSVQFFLDTPLDDGGSPIQTIDVTTENSGSSSPIINEAETVTTLSGLTNGKEYTFEIRAYNKYYGGEILTLKFTPGLAVDVPIINLDTDIVNGDKSATISWKDPLNSTPGSILSYEISFEEGPWENIGYANSYVVGGLKNGLLYRVKIRAITETGPGNDLEVLVSPRGAPGEVYGIETNVHPDGTVVFWEGIKDYGFENVNFEYRMMGEETWIDTKENWEIYFTDLVADETYTLEIRAFNEFGYSPIVSHTFINGTRLGVAGFIDDKVRTSSEQAWLEWNNPNIEEGEPELLSYEYRLDDSEWTNIGLTNSIHLTNLKNHHLYEFRIRGVNKNGPGMSNMINFYASDEPPVSPDNLRFRPDYAKSEGKLSWSPSHWVMDFERAAYYEVKVNEQPWIRVDDASEYIFTDLEINANYAFYVRGVNENGYSKISSMGYKYLELPDKPQDIMLTSPQDGTIVATWEAPNNDYHGEILSYEINLYGSSTQNVNILVDVGTATTYIFSELPPNLYTFTVEAITQYGKGVQGLTMFTLFS